jgi:hypothetical protein
MTTQQIVATVLFGIFTSGLLTGLAVAIRRDLRERASR